MSLRTIGLFGNPNAGKTTLFNYLTNLRHTTGNYPGVTVERKAGQAVLSSEQSVRVLDLPGAYSLFSQAPDEQVVRQVVFGQLRPEERPELGVLVLDASNLERNLYFALQMIDTGLPFIAALNMWDAAGEKERQPNLQELERLLGIPCVSTVAHRGKGLDELKKQIEKSLKRIPLGGRVDQITDVRLATVTPEERYKQVEAIVKRVVPSASKTVVTTSDRIDAIVTHPVWGWMIFAGIMAFIFQSIFMWAEPFMNLIQTFIDSFGAFAAKVLPSNALGDLVTEGIIPGVGNVVIFLPQIFLLFFFIALAEDFGYMARAAFVLDRIMRRVGLNGKAFLPLLSSFACAIPGIMATRNIQDPKDRMTTILVAPLMSCSARLPVYSLLIGAFIPSATLLGFINTQGLTLFLMYTLSIIAGLGMATLFRRTIFKGRGVPFIMELPPYRIPHLQTVLAATWERGKVFLMNAGSVILAISIILWFLASYPKNPEIAAKYEVMRQQATVQTVESAEIQNVYLAEIDQLEKGEHLRNSFAGRLGKFIEPVIAPLGFDWKIGIGLIASFAAREVLVSTLAIIYNVGEADETSVPLITALRAEKDMSGQLIYSPLFAVSLMVFFVLACQCMSTVAVVRRETNSVRWPLFMVVYMTLLAWLGSFLVYQGGRLLGWGV